MKVANLIKTSGYGSSVASVFLLAVPSLKNAVQNPIFMICLVGGVVTSIVGMAARWYSYQIEEK